MSNTLRLTGVMAAIAVTLFFIMSIGVTKAHANPSYFQLSTASASATTSVVYMSAGTATTTLSFDTTNGYGSKLDSAFLAIQFAGSSTASILNVDVQYSQDNKDWYPSSFAWAADNGGFATSSPSIASSTSYRLDFASSTIDRSAGVTGTTTRAVIFRVPLRYIKAIFTLAPGSTAGAVWAQFIGVRQNP